LSSDKIVIEIDRDIYRLCMACAVVAFLPVFIFIITPLTGFLAFLFGWYFPISIFVVWPLVVILFLYCLSRWESEPSPEADSIMNQPE